MENFDNSDAIIETENTDGAEGAEQDGGGLEADSVGATEISEPKTPAWETFIAACGLHAQALGLETKEQVGFVQYKNPVTGHKLYVAKQGKEVKRVDTTLELIGVLDGAYRGELDTKPNGRIACHIPADVATVNTVLEMLASESAKLRAPKRTAKSGAPAQS